jgi:hypothetical protein
MKAVPYQITADERIEVFIDSSLEAAMCAECQQVSTQVQDTAEPQTSGASLSAGQNELAQRGYPLVKALCLDKITIHKGHGHYRLVLSAPELGLVLDVLPDRNFAHFRLHILVAFEPISR